MAFVVTKVSTKGNVSDPDFSSWLSTLDPNVLSGFPDVAGQTPQEVVDSYMENVVNVVSGGFVSEEVTVSDDQSVTTLVTTWESQSQFELHANRGYGFEDPTPGNISTTTDSNIVTGYGTFFTSNLQIGANIIAQEFVGDIVALVGTVQSIESDTSLTLTENASINANVHLGYGLYSEETPLAFLCNLYASLYLTTVETTYANV
jgi:hypothetical protein